MGDCPAGRLLSFPPPVYACERGVRFIWQSFARKAVPVLSQARIYEMTLQLTKEMSVKGEEIIQSDLREQEEERHNVEATVIREAAQHFALRLADNIARGSLQVQADKLVSAKFHKQLAEHLLSSVQQAVIEESVKSVVIDAISVCASLTVEKLSEIFVQ